MLLLSRYNRRPRNPRPGRRLSRGFVAANGKPSGLWVPTPGLGPKAYDFAPSGLGIGNVGSLNGGVTVQPGGWGVFGQGWSLNGSTQSITLGAANIIIPPSTTEATIFAVVAPSNLSTDQRILSFGLASVSTAFGLFSGRTTINTFGCFGRTAASALVQVNSSDTYTANQVHLVAATVHGTTLSLFVDGIPEGSAVCDVGVTLQSMGSAVTDAIAFAPPGIGAAPAFSGKGFLVGVILKALSAAQLSSLYNYLRSGQPYPLFAASPNERFMASFAAPAGSNWPWFISDGFGYLIGA